MKGEGDVDDQWGEEGWSVKLYFSTFHHPPDPGLADPAHQNTLAGVPLVFINREREGAVGDREEHVF